MISLARQPGKAKEALEFRNENHEELEEQEKVYGTLETRLAGFKKENRLYKTAKAMRDEGKLKYQDAWWNKHASEITKAELFYGLLLRKIETTATRMYRRFAGMRNGSDGSNSLATLS